MSLSKSEIVERATFGNWVAENERAQLSQYFIRTRSLSWLVEGKRDVIRGPTGSGKTALFYTLVDNKWPPSPNKERRLVVPITNPIAELAFQRYTTNQLGLSEVAFRHTWGLLFIASAVGGIIDSGVKLGPLMTLAVQLKRLGVLNRAVYTSGDVFRAAIEAMRNFNITFEPADGTIVFGAPKLRSSSPERTSIIELLRVVNEFLVANKLEVWVCLDRLDVCFPPQTDLEAIGLRALLNAYNDIRAAGESLQPKLFLRSDIWSSVLSRGPVREVEQINSRSIDILWTDDDLKLLLAERIFANEPIADLMGVARSEKGLCPSEAEKMFELFPERILGDAGPLFRWVTANVSDGRGSYGPRDVIKIFVGALEAQQRRAASYVDELPENQLLEPDSFSTALNAASHDRLNVLFSDNAWALKHVEKLRNGRDRYDAQQLAQEWGVDENEGADIATKLTDIGFFKKWPEAARPYAVGPIYQPTLRLGRFK